MPRVERITEIKWIQVFSSNGADEDLVRSRTSTLEMLPITHS